MTITFICLSSINHLLTTARERIHTFRFLGAIALAAGAAPVIYLWGVL